MSGDIDTIACALWGRGAPPQNLVGLLIALVNLLVHLPFTDLPVLRDYKLGELRSQYDYVIVGGGSAGCVIANRLSANPDITVLLLEAGGLEEASRQVPVTASYNLGGHDDWAYLTVPQKNACLSFQGQRCPMSRGKVLGGSSVLNFMMYVRGNRHDYDRWAQTYGAAGWSYQDVLPHFKDIEDFRAGPVNEYHGTNGEVPVGLANASTPLSKLFLDACKESGYSLVDYNGATQSGCSRLQINMANGERFSSSKAFIHPVLRTRRNLDVALFSQVTKVNFEGNHAVGVTFTRYGKAQNVSARREVILSAGTIGSAHLLLLSGVGPREDLERLQIPVVADLPVGRSIQEHSFLFTAMPVRTDWQVGMSLFSLEDIAQYDSNRSGIITIPTAIEAVQFLSTQYAVGPDSPDIELAIASSQPASQLARAEILNFGVLPEAYDKYLGPNDNVPGFRVGIIHNRPKSRGTITLHSSDPNDYPEIDLHLLEHPDDAKAAAEGTKIFIDRILTTKAMKSIGAKPWDVTFPPCADAGPRWSLEYIECLLHHLASPGLHICCSVPMGSHDSAVVDERLRVRGNVTGLRVADVSVMPEILSGNTHAAAMMIGSKAAAMIAEDNDHE
ncbi:glucose dehydrogenase [FAD, quinone] [Dermacentor silvarum]|uniref:glucose dehydrogenase [FAD, quinone] n=1 Tax=Dermacentor silvarum TaxID=543639 RepID=UPI0021012549|nr:glucose dehydrogenase [FAD, quinone] [Dermacentor silvarum]